MEVLVEQDVVAPVRILPELLGSATDGTLATPVEQKDARESPANLLPLQRVLL